MSRLQLQVARAVGRSSITGPFPPAGPGRALARRRNRCQTSGRGRALTFWVASGHETVKSSRIHARDCRCFEFVDLVVDAGERPETSVGNLRWRAPKAATSAQIESSHRSVGPGVDMLGR